MVNTPLQRVSSSFMRLGSIVPAGALCVTLVTYPYAVSAYASSSCPVVQQGADSARWQIKTTLKFAGALPAAKTIAIRDFVRAPNLASMGSSIELSRIPQAVTIGGTAYHEGDIVSVTGRVLEAPQCKGDGDHHITLVPGNDPSRCLIVEVPTPAEIHSASLKSLVTKANTDAATQARAGHDLTVTGQLFYDAHHAPGSRGKSHCGQTLWEVHPITQIG